jgi:hypothetical protein
MRFARIDKDVAQGEAVEWVQQWARSSAGRMPDKIASRPLLGTDRRVVCSLLVGFGGSGSFHEWVRQVFWCDTPACQAVICGVVCDVITRAQIKKWNGLRAISVTLKRAARPKVYPFVRTSQIGGCEDDPIQDMLRWMGCRPVSVYEIDTGLPAVGRYSR